MAKETFNDFRDEVRDLQEENEGIFQGNGSLTEFMDYLDNEEQERLKQMEELAEKRKKWLRLFEKMQEEIACRNFDEAYETFEILSNDLFE